MGRSRPFVGAIAVALACGGFAAQAASAADPQVRGPASIVPGRLVHFRATGFRPGNTVIVVVAPARRSSCCAIQISSMFVASPTGAVQLGFRFPSYYQRCPPWQACVRIPWKRGETVIVTVTGYLEQAATKTSVR